MGHIRAVRAFFCRLFWENPAVSVRCPLLRVSRSSKGFFFSLLDRLFFFGTMQGTQRTVEHSVGLVKTLTLMPIVMIGLAYIQPMTLFDTFGIVSQITSGHVPSAYALALLGILFTALVTESLSSGFLLPDRPIPMPKGPCRRQSALWSGGHRF